MRSAAEWLYALLAAGSLCVALATEQHEPRIPLNVVQGWSVKLGKELWHFGEFVTRRKQVQDSFKSAQMETRDGKKLAQNMVDDLHAMMQLKISAIRRIVDSAEAAAFDSHQDEVPLDYQFYNSKEMGEPWSTETSTPAPPPTPEPDEGTIARPPSLDAHLQPNTHFYHTPVNTNFSSVHVPTSVYSWAPQVIKGIYWSEKLDSIFIDNYRKDPTLSWQYFGSSAGFMRHYPAMKWTAEPVDMYDCRMRAWYMGAAASPRDVLVLVDRSGSMTGQRRDIARHVVATILDTLGNNDFVNVLTFSETVDELVPCFRDSLVQANLGNIQELKLGLENFETAEIANFSAALERAFTLLQDYRTSDNTRGAGCNQAIMLVTDGVPYNYKEIFQRLNWNFSTPVRVFTYLIGREVADVREVKWMACANRGLYVHLSTMAEVRERVLEHLNVLARPLVLHRQAHPVVWTQLYAHLTDPKIADYQWDQRERIEQKERFMIQRKAKTPDVQREKNYKWKLAQLQQGQQSEVRRAPHRLVASVAMPVYDTRDYENITENVLINEALWVSVTKEVRIANLLGVAATDVPLQEIEALMTPYKLGVNGYAFLVTNNGYVLVHPDLRPVFQGILKPSYNSVDLLEVELADDERAPRNFSLQLLAIRKHIIDQNTGNEKLNVKYHMDDMRRVARGRRHYFWRGVPDSPLTLVVALPEPHGLHRVAPPPTDDIHRSTLAGNGVAATHYFRSSDKWSVHPDWLYCRHYNRTFPRPQDELLYFLERTARPGWRWPSRPRPPEHHPAATPATKPNHNKEQMDHPKEHARDNYYCDHGLMQAVVFDARNTEWFNHNISVSTKDDFKEEFMRRFGVTVAFLATHSGLTRWQTFPAPPHPASPPHPQEQFGEQHPRAVDEVWYRRAVEHHYVDPDSFVYSVDLKLEGEYLKESAGVSETEAGLGAGAGEWSGAGAGHVLASHAIFHSEGARQAPAAVVGFSFTHAHLRRLFDNLSASGGESGDCSCGSEQLECFLIDDHAYVLLGTSPDHTGAPFALVRGEVMAQLVQEGVFAALRVPDYQAVCFRDKSAPAHNPAPRAPQPLRQARAWLNTLLTALVTAGARALSPIATLTPLFEQLTAPDANITESGEESEREQERERERELDNLLLLNRTRPTPCDTETTLYTLNHDNLQAKLAKQMHSCERPFVVASVANTNLLLVVVDALCPPRPVPPPPARVELPYPQPRACLLHQQGLYRARTASCIASHVNESMITMCGRGATALASLLPLLTAFVARTAL